MPFLIVALLVVGVGVGSYVATAASKVVRQIVYTAPTANDAQIVFPDELLQDLRTDGLDHQKVKLTRISSKGEATSSVIDLTPRQGDHVLKVKDRALPVIDAKIAEIEKTVNTTAAETGSRALYIGLTKADFESSAPIVVISQGLDLKDPTDFRKLGWKVPPEKLITTVSGADLKPDLHGSVLFVVVPSAGTQVQLGQSERRYRNEMWQALLRFGGADDVHFVEAVSTGAAGTMPAPNVSLKGNPATPHDESSHPPELIPKTCTVPAGYFVENTARLLNRTKTTKNLRPCISKALRGGATFQLDGWTSYDGPLDKNGRPATDYDPNRRLSRERIDKIASVLVDDLDVPESAITGRHAHGNTDQPDPKHPRSAKNRVVIIHLIKPLKEQLT